MASVVSVETVFSEARTGFTKAIYKVTLDTAETFLVPTVRQDGVTEAEDKTARGAQLLESLALQEIGGELNNG